MAEQQKEQGNYKGFATRFDMNDPQDSKVLRLLSIARTVGGVSPKKIVELGVKAYIQTPDFKEKAKLIKEAL